MSTNLGFLCSFFHYHILCLKEYITYYIVQERESIFSEVVRPATAPWESTTAGPNHTQIERSWLRRKASYMLQTCKQVEGCLIKTWAIGLIFLGVWMAYQRKLFFSRERVKGASAGDSVTAGSSDQVWFFFDAFHYSLLLAHETTSIFRRRGFFFCGPKRPSALYLKKGEKLPFWDRDATHRGALSHFFSQISVKFSSTRLFLFFQGLGTRT